MISFFAAFLNNIYTLKIPKLVKKRFILKHKKQKSYFGHSEIAFLVLQIVGNYSVCSTKF
jgi:hypothetical protein